jgi:hypothetical protein
VCLFLLPGSSCLLNLKRVKNRGEMRKLIGKLKKNGGERIFVNNIKETKAGEKAGSVIDA